ncbi:MAG TPA: pyridoxamine 5'-phosphate oxidase [Bacteroidales bacterium]
MNLKNIRREYKLMELNKNTIDSDPFKQFAIWLKDAMDSSNPEPTAMVLTTISVDGRPSSRIVLLKHSSEAGFEFFTNYQSKKGRHLKDKPFGSLLFFWPEMERQVRIEGRIEKLDEEVSDEYFSSRPVESQIGAWASPQSTVIPNRRTLLDWYEEFENIFKTTPMTRPSHWGGYRLIPDLFEFWQGREKRLHDRIEFRRGKNAWTINRLAP